MVPVDELGGWYERLRAELDPARYSVEWQGPAQGRSPQAAVLNVDGPDRLAQLTVWDTGEAQLALGDVPSGEVSDEHLRLADAAALAAAVSRMTGWVTMGRGTSV